MDFAVARYAVWRAGVAAGTAATAFADGTSATPNLSAASNLSGNPDVSFIPPLERRRLTGVERAALSVAWQVRPEGEVPVVFASRWGEIGVTVKLMQQFHADREMSPAGFSASVHNAAPGAFSLLTHNHAPYTAIAARARSLEAGILEALVQGTAVAGRPPYRGPVVFVFAEEATPAFYAPAFGPLQPACALAVRIEPGGPFRAAFRAAACAPVSFDAADAFFSGRADALEAASFTLTRA